MAQNPPVHTNVIWNILDRTVIDVTPATALIGTIPFTAGDVNVKLSGLFPSLLNVTVAPIIVVKPGSGSVI